MIDQRPWLKNYPEGVPANINPDAYPNLLALLEDTFKKYKNKPAFSNMGKEMTYAQIDKMSKYFGAYLHSRGLDPPGAIPPRLQPFVRSPLMDVKNKATRLPPPFPIDHHKSR